MPAMIGSEERQGNSEANLRPASHRRPTGRISILHLEDNPADVEIIGYTIRKRYPTCTITHVDTEAAYQEELHCDKYDLILSDYRVPGFNGDQALAYARKHCPDMPFIMVTGELGEEFAIERLKSGAADYVLKDNLKRLVPAIERALDEAKERQRRREAEEKLRDTVEELTAITEELHVQNKELDEAHRLLQSILNSAKRSHLVYLDRNFNLVHVNEAYAKTCGYTPEEMVGKNHFALYPHEENERIFARVRDTGVPEEYHDKPFVFPDQPERGTTYWDWTLEPVKDSSGMVEGLVLSLTETTVRKRLEESLRESERRQADLIKFAPAGIYEIDFRTRKFKSVNDVMCQLSGYSREELLSMDPFDILEPESKIVFRQRIEKWFAGEQPDETVEYTVRTKDGRKINVLVNATFTRDESGKPLGATVVGYDITERKEAEESLRLSEEKFFKAFHGNIAVMAITRMHDGLYLDVNDRFSELTGYRREEIVGRTAGELDVWKDPGDRDRFVRELRQHGAVQNQEFAFVAKSGKEWVGLVSSQVTTLRGEEVIISSIMDVTERRRAEAELQRERAYLRQIIDLNPNFIFAKDREGHFTLINQAVADAYGTTVGNLLGKTDADFNPDTAEVEFFRRMDLEVMDTLQPRHIPQEKITDAQGNVRWLQTVKIPIAGSDGKAEQVLGVSVDITERKHAEEEARKFNAELEARVKERTGDLSAANKELESFSYSISHDLRAPLRAIMGFASLLLEESADKLTPEEQQNLKIISQNASQMGKLIEELLTFSRLNRQELVRTSVDFNLLVQEIVQLHRTAEPKRSVTITIHALPPAQADPVLIRQVWDNLLSNAFKYTRNCREKAVIEIGACRKNSETVYSVKDNGAGFDMKYYNKLFGVFQRLHRSEEYEGTGVGLAFTQRILQRHGGRIWAEAKPDEGATFYFTLP